MLLSLEKFRQLYVSFGLFLLVASCFVVFLSFNYAFGQIAPVSPDEERKTTNSVDYQNRLIDADNSVSLARSSLERRDYRQASNLLISAIKIYSRHNQKESMGKVFTMLGFINRELGNDRDADIYFRNALVSYRVAEDYLNSGKIAGMLGNIYLSQGSVPKACRSWDVAYEFFRKIGDEFFANKSFDLVREHDCPDVIRHLSPEEAFPSPVALGKEAQTIDLILGKVSDDFEIVGLGEDVEEDTIADDEYVDYATISQEGRGVLDALRIDALTKTAETLMSEADQDGVSDDKKEALFREASGIFTKLENYERVLEVQLRLARDARSLKKINKMESYYNSAINTARITDDFEQVVGIGLELADALKQEKEFKEALNVVARARGVAEQINASNLLISALDEQADIYIRQNNAERACQVFVDLIREGDNLDEVFLVNDRLIVMAKNSCASPGGKENTYLSLSKNAQAQLNDKMRSVAEQISKDKGPDRETKFYLLLAQYLLDRTDYTFSEQAYLAAAEVQSKEGNYEKVTGIMQSLSALARIMDDSEKQQFYNLRVRTSRLDVLHRDKTAVELGNLGIDSAQEGDIDAACYFWDRAVAELDPNKDASIVNIMKQLSEDYKCVERIKGMADEGGQGN